MQSLSIFQKVFVDGKMTLPRALIISLIGFLIVFIVLGVIAFFVKIMGAVFDSAQKKRKVEPVVADSSAGVPLPEGTSKGSLKLVGVSESEAAVIMAIVSDKSGIPLNRLQFNSIKCISEEE